MHLLLFLTLMGWQEAKARSPLLNPNEVILIINAPGMEAKSGKIYPDNSLPRNWRTTNDSYKKKDLHLKNIPSREGLDQLKISGSGEFSKGQFKEIQKTLKDEKLLVLDLREEPHGFVNHLAVSWYGENNAINHSKSLSEIEKDETKRLLELAGKKTIKLVKWAKTEEIFDQSGAKPVAIQVPVESTSTEQDFVKSLGNDYFRVPVPDHQKPSAENIDYFIQIYKKIKKDQWVHFHCAAGEGRTTVFMTMFDMMKNCKKISAKEIIERQYLLGGIDLLNSEKLNPKRRKWAEERALFIQRFFDYCQQESPEFKKSWSEWEGDPSRQIKKPGQSKKTL